jgi:hypothetical protein
MIVNRADSTSDAISLAASDSKVGFLLPPGPDR